MAGMLVARARLLALLLFFALLQGCAANEVRSGELAQVTGVEQAISGTDAKIDNTGVSSSWIGAVGQLQFSTGNFGNCTGTLIAPNVVLTAGHWGADRPRSSGRSGHERAGVTL